MSDSLSYSPEEISKILKISKGTVYELIRRGEIPSYRVGKKIRVNPADLEIYTKSTLPISKTVTPSGPVNIERLILESQGLILCGQDVVLDVLTRHMEKQSPLIRSLRSYVGSVDGLFALYRGTANATATHLLDAETGEYNLPYVRRMLPGQRVVVINLVYRTQGFYVAPGNPKSILKWEDLLRPDVRFVNREKGSGTRVLLDERLRHSNLDPKLIQGYDNEEMSHIAVASAVARGVADVGVGTEKAALQVREVEFIPLQKERYDLVLYKEDLEKPIFQTLVSVLRSREFRNEIDGMGGYDISKTGEVMGET
ncbi:substrate-binding domain-containing protein [Brevibacillus sp. SYSU BS000544]|uniref:substrate-binding domain-containing protein n=1 Tax=Brevibacillus sp. SYSU BS000544 TaxID=3416443 RepID=UPI003CE4B360